MAVTTVTIDNFKTEVLDAKEPVLVDFWAEWCNPCRMLAPVVESLSGEYEGKARFCKVNIDEASDLAMTYGVMSIPTLVIFSEDRRKNALLGFKMPRSCVRLSTGSCNFEGSEWGRHTRCGQRVCPFLLCCVRPQANGKQRA